MIMGLGIASLTIFFVIVIYGAFATSNYLGGISQTMNSTTWDFAQDLFGEEIPLVILAIPLSLLALAIIGVLIWLFSGALFKGGLDS